jgi:hypothetical protein
MVKVQMLARWSELAFKRQQTDPNEAELRRIIGGDDESDNGMIHTEVVHEYGPVTFFMEDVKSYNRSKEEGHTTVKFKDGDTLVLKIPYYDFMEVDIQTSGNQILDYLPLDYIDPQEEILGEDDEDLEL